MSQDQLDAEAFRNFERAAHDEIADGYRDFFTAVTRYAVDPLLDAVMDTSARAYSGRRHWPRRRGLQGCRSRSLVGRRRGSRAGNGATGLGSSLSQRGVS
jgi:hypothetical protein